MLNKLKSFFYRNQRVAWTEARNLKVGDRIAVTSSSVIPASPSVIPAKAGIHTNRSRIKSGMTGVKDSVGMTNNLEFDQILSIKPLGRKQVYDIEIKDTHNFVANGILAHNTIVTGNLGIGTTNPSSKLDVTTASLGTTQTTNSGLALVNTTAAAVGAQQISPAIRWSGFGWKTDATESSQAVDFRSHLVPVQGTANPTGYLTFQSSVNGGAYADRMTITTGGVVNATDFTCTDCLDFDNFEDTLNLDATLTLNMSTNNIDINYTSGDALFINGTSGNVGIGTASPLQKLDLVTGSAYGIGGTSVLNATTLGTNVVTSSLTTVGALTSGSIASGFGTIATANTITGTTINGTTGINTGASAGTLRLSSTGALSNITTLTLSGAISGGTTYSGSGNITSTAGVLTIQGSGNSSFVGNVGIGTASPPIKLTVQADGAVIRVRNSVSTQYRSDWGVSSVGTTTINSYDDTGGVYTPFYLKSSTLNVYTGSAGGTLGLTQDASGNVGIGTAGPTTKFHVYGTDATIIRSLVENAGTGQTSLEIKRSGGTASDWILWAPGSSTDLRIYDANSGGVGDVVTFQKGGNVGIGTTGPQQQLSINRATDSTIPALGAEGGTFSIKTAGVRGLIAGNIAGGNFFMQVQRVDGTATAYNLLLQPTSGNVGIGTATPGYKLTVNSSTPGCNGCTAWTNYSDIRLKENIDSLPGGILDKIMELKPISFNYNDTYYSQTGYSRPNGTTPTFSGFIAQDLQQIFPEMVSTASSGYLDANLSNLQIYLVKAMQELNAKIDSLNTFASLVAANFRAGVAVIQDLTVDTLVVKQKLISPLAIIDTLEVENLTAQKINAPQISRIEKDLQDLAAKYSTASAIRPAADFAPVLDLQSPVPLSPESFPDSLILTDIQINNSLIVNTINSKDQDALFLQPLANAPINLLAGLMILDPSGQIIINGDLAVTGKILAQQIQSLQADLENLTSKTATIAALTTNQLIIKNLSSDGASRSSDPALSGSSSDVRSAPTDPTAATAVIPAGQTEITIDNANINQDTLVYLTAISSTNNQTLFVKSQTINPPSFVVAIPQPIDQPIKFNYWLIQSL